MTLLTNQQDEHTQPITGEVFRRLPSSNKYSQQIYPSERTNRQLNVRVNEKPVRNTETYVQGSGPRGSQTGPERSPVMIGGVDIDSEQSAPMKPTANTWNYVARSTSVAVNS